MKTIVVFLGLCCLLANGLPTTDKEKKPTTVTIASNITLNNGVDFGKWGEAEFCLGGSYARDMEAKFEDYTLLHTDETALNALKLSCMIPGDHHTGEISSTIGERGEWKGLKSCSNGLMTGMRARVLPYQGTFSDDVAVQNVEMDCNYGESTVLAIEEDSNIKDGEWSSWGNCTGNTLVCGIQIRYEKPFLIEDTMGISDIVVYCCYRQAPVSTISPPTELPDTTTDSWEESTVFEEDFDSYEDEAHEDYGNEEDEIHEDYEEEDEEEDY